MVVQIVFGDSQIPVEKTEKLLLHEVDFGQAEAKVVEASNGSVPRPVFVLGRGIVQVLCCQNEGSEEDAVGGAFHAFRDWG